MTTDTLEKPGAGTLVGSGGHPQAPPVPNSLEETGLSGTLVSDLILKTLYLHGAQTGRFLADNTRLPFAVLDPLILVLQQRRFVEVRGTDGHGRASYVFDLTGEGRDRARDRMETNAYVGAAPVPVEMYREFVARQSVRLHPIPEQRIQDGLRHLVLDPEFVDRLGPGINSGQSVFLHGRPGNGKTEIAFSIADIMGTSIHIPYAVEIHGQIVQLYDPHVHRRWEEDQAVRPAPDFDQSILAEPPGHDLRFVHARRPAVIVGGELTLDELELRAGPQRGVFIAPPQMKANGGVFVIDDFGRQRVRPRDLLNRWMIPLDRGTDFLALPTGYKLEVPFDCLVLFATNLDPTELVEEAFLRRIRHKIHLDSPTRADFAEILRRVCDKRGIGYNEGAVDLVYEEFYDRLDIEARSCHPRDLVADLCDYAQYRGVEPSLSRELLRKACHSYFIEIPEARAGAGVARGVGSGSGGRS